MNAVMENVLAGLAVTAAALYLLRRIWLALRAPATGQPCAGCSGGCARCPESDTPPPDPSPRH
jgi:hypothetical protein